MRPVVGTVVSRVLRVVGAEHDRDDVPLVCGERGVLRPLPERGVRALRVHQKRRPPVSPGSREKDMDTLTSHLHHGRAAGAHVGNLVLARVLDIEHDLKLARVRVISAGGTYARRDGIADAADEDLCKACRAGSAVGRANGVCISLACSGGDITCASESFF